MLRQAIFHKGIQELLSFVSLHRSAAVLDTSERAIQILEPLNTFEARYFNLLRAQPVYRLEGNTLMLIDDRHSAKFRRVSGAAKP